MAWFSTYEGIQFSARFCVKLYVHYWIVSHRSDTKQLVSIFVCACLKGYGMFVKMFFFSVPVVVEGTLSFKDQCVKWHNEFRMKHQVNDKQYGRKL